jgi:hypothetical protein
VFWPRARLFYTIFGGELGEGAIVVSRDAAPVDFADLLNDRVANLVPVDAVEDTFRSLTPIPRR